MSEIARFPVKPCFPYVGGKSFLKKHILPLIPPHKTYLEPFAGGLAVLLAKERSRVECINDANSEIVNFYRYVRNHLEALKAELAGHLNSRSDFEYMMQATPVTDLQKAVRWYLLKVCSFGAYSNSWGRAKSQYHGFDEDRHLALISAVAERLKRVLIECGDWETVVTFFDTPETFTYFDPPYIEADPGACYDAFSKDEMARLRNRCDQLVGSWILSCDDSPSCREIFDGHYFLQLPIRYPSRRRNKEIPLSHELLILSPDLAAAQKKAAA